MKTSTVRLTETVVAEIEAESRRRKLSLPRRGALVCGYRFSDDMDAVLKLLDKYSDVCR